MPPLNIHRAILQPLSIPLFPLDVSWIPRGGVASSAAGAPSPLVLWILNGPFRAASATRNRRSTAKTPRGTETIDESLATFNYVISRRCCWHQPGSQDCSVTLIGNASRRLFHRRIRFDLNISSCRKFWMSQRNRSRYDWLSQIDTYICIFKKFVFMKIFVNNIKFKLLYVL